MKWIKRIHPHYKAFKWLYDNCELRNNYDLLVGKWQHTYTEDGKQLYSIIEPSQTTFGYYELYDNEEIYRFPTLKEAKNMAQKLYEEK